MKGILSQMWRAIRYNIGSLLLFEAGFRTAVFFLMIQAAEKCVGLSLSYQGFSYLTAENYREFLASPVSLLCLFLLLLLLLLFFLIEVSALLCCFMHSSQKRRIYASDMVMEGIRITFSFLKKGKAGWVLCTALSAPFLSLYLLIREVSYINILEFSAREIYKAVTPHWILYLGIGLVLALSFSFVFTLPYCLLEREKSLKGMKAGIRLLLAQIKKVLAGFAVLHILIIFVTGICYLLAMAGMTGIVALSGSAESKVSSVLIYSKDIDMALGIFAGAVQLIFSLAFVYVIYARFHQQKTEEVALYRLVKHYAWFSRVGRRRAAAVVTTLFLLLEAGYLTVLVINEKTDLKGLDTETQITAHRGGALKAPENTLSALEYTWECGADCAEIDVQETKDGVLILLHDNSFKRTAGLDKNVWDMEYAKVEKLDAGISFHNKFRGEKIPTLEEVLNFCRRGLDLNIEIKYNGKNKGIVNKVVRTIREHEFQEHCVVTSMNYQFLEQIKKIAPEIRTGYIMTMTYGSIAQVEAADFFSVKYTYVDEDFVKEAHSLGKEVHAWTVNYRGDVRRMLDMGVDNIITDDPEMVRRVQSQESGTGTGYLELLRYALGI